MHDTVEVAQEIGAPLELVWAAYADADKRVQWSVPAGEGMVYDKAEFREGGRDRYRCGDPTSLEFHASVEYTKIVPEALIVYTETVQSAGQPLATGVVTWEFEPTTAGTYVRVISHIVSFVGGGMVDGTRNGHTKALQQLSTFATTDTLSQ